MESPEESFIRCRRGALLDVVTNPTWHDEARSRLLGLEVRPGSWSERPGGRPRVEATALAALALMAGGNRSAESDADDAAHRAADWLAAVQHPEGSLADSPESDGPGWVTPLAVWLWTALGTHPGPCGRATDWLLRRRGLALKLPPDERAAIGHDPTIPGWPWVAGTSAWVEPTAMAVLALRGLGLGDGGRVRDGQRLIRDRVLAAGGWNYGNTTVFGHDLVPHPQPTALALLALRGEAGEAEPLVCRSLAYLDRAVAATRAPLSLGWGLLALRAWGRRPAGSASWLVASFEAARRHPAPARRLALLLLAQGDRSLGWIGLEDPGRSRGT